MPIVRPIIQTLAAAAACAAAAAAVAAPARLSDAQFIAANRCLGIESGKSPGPDALALRQLVKSQGWGRTSFIYDEADAARDDGARDASRAGAETSVRLSAERAGPCRGFVATTTAAASPANTR